MRGVGVGDDDGVGVVRDRAIDVAGVGVGDGVGARVAAGASDYTVDVERARRRGESVERVRGVRRKRRESGQHGAGGGEREWATRVDSDALRRGGVRHRNAHRRNARFERAVLGEAAGRPRRGFRGGDETFVVVSGEDVLARRAVVRRLCAARVPRSVSPGLGELGGSTLVRALEANPRSRRSGVHQMGTMGVDALRRVSSRHVSRTRAPPGGST